MLIIVMWSTSSSMTTTIGLPISFDLMHNSPDGTLSWGLTYNLYADKLLATNVFPSSIYDMRAYP